MPAICIERETLGPQRPPRLVVPEVATCLLPRAYASSPVPCSLPSLSCYHPAAPSHILLDTDIVNQSLKAGAQAEGLASLLEALASLLEARSWYNHVCFSQFFQK